MPVPRPHLHPDDVVQSNRLIHGEQIVKAVRPRRANAQAEVDLGEGADGDHGVMIVTTEDTEDTEVPARWSFIRVIRASPWLRPSLVVDRELESRIRREQFCHFLQPLRHLGRRQKGVIALAQVVIIHVDK